MDGFRHRSGHGGLVSEPVKMTIESVHAEKLQPGTQPLLTAPELYQLVFDDTAQHCRIFEYRDYLG